MFFSGEYSAVFRCVFIYLYTKIDPETKKPSMLYFFRFFDYTIDSELWYDVCSIMGKNKNKVVRMVIFVFDVGNTNIVLGVYDEDVLKHHWRIETNRNKTEDEYGMMIKSLFDHAELSFNDIDGIIISSVVPPIMFSLERMCQKYFQLKPLVVGPGIKTGLNIKYENPREVGADRIVNAVAAIHEYGSPLVVEIGRAHV